MRILNIICGLAVILTSLHMVHGVHHFMGAPPSELSGHVGYWGGISLAAVMVGLSFTGGVLLMRRPR